MPNYGAPERTRKKVSGEHLKLTGEQQKCFYLGFYFPAFFFRGYEMIIKKNMDDTIPPSHHDSLVLGESCELVNLSVCTNGPQVFSRDCEAQRGTGPSTNVRFVKLTVVEPSELLSFFTHCGITGTIRSFL